MSKQVPKTHLTDEFGVHYPFVCAGMAFVGAPPLAAAVANAGGVGMIGVAPEQPPGVLSLIRATHALTDRPFGVNFIVDATAFGPMTTDAHLEVCVEAGVKLVTSGDFEEMCMPAGEGVRVIKRLQPAAHIVAEMMEDARRALEEQLAGRTA